MSLLHVAILLPFLAAALLTLFHKLRQSFHTGWLVLPVPLVLFVYFLLQIPEVQSGHTTHVTIPWMPSLGVEFSVLLDGLSLLFALLISGMGTLVVLYSIFYLDKTREALKSFYAYLLLFMGAMLGVVLSDNLMVLYSFWEITTISSFLLIAFWYNRETSRYGAFKSLLITVFGGLAMLAGFILLYLMTGTFSIREMMGSLELVTNHALFIPAMLLVLLGAFTKSAQFPFHIWLPDAMEAPTPVSAYLHSATMVKAGLYLVARMSPVFAGSKTWFWVVTAVGLCTLLYGSFRAMKQRDLKALLAFSTISQLGLIMSLLGAGSAAAFYSGTQGGLVYTTATLAAIFHLINHAIFKGSLFMVVGIVDHETGTRDLRKLGGLMSLMPITFSIALIGSLSMAGLPPFNGFLSKEMFYTALLSIAKMDVMNLQTIGILIPLVAWIASVFTFGYSMIFVFRTFTGPAQIDKLGKTPHEAPIGLLLAPVILASLAVVFGLFPNLLSYSILEPAMASIHPGLLTAGERFEVSISMWHGWTPELFMTLGVILAGTMVYLAHQRFKPLHQPLLDKISLNWAFDNGLQFFHKGSNSLTQSYMTGSVRHYLIYIFSFFILSLSWMLFRTDSFAIPFESLASVSAYELIVNLALIIVVVSIPFVRSRMMAIILTSASGYIVTLFFVIFRAPDLALTQMIIETVSGVLFLLCFYHLPKRKLESAKRSFKWMNLLIAVGVGTLMTLISLKVSGSKMFESISDYYLKFSYELAGGKNVVNVILVDFRGFDTMLEIVVLGIASLGIYALIRLNLEKNDETPSRSPVPWLAYSNNVILRTISSVAVLIIITFSFYLFFAGHHQPGGGFIGALMTSAALILLTMVSGLDTIQQVIPLNFRKLTAAGLLVAALTGVGSFLFKLPFLSHSFGYFYLPILGKTELATAVLFDLGVFMTVIGITMTIILEIGRDK
ncbi:Na+/H+ antiporter subunit A [Paenibacillus sanguinis]|uniref:Na+/H+ antiporter subunit A n=1 Tax=Paenibacillus sanguinis TaxID=225906 RepID=UPI00037E0B20|nr:Na+/H+ antiporter subunit A [Paenibacillus sanguinis]